MLAEILIDMAEDIRIALVLVVPIGADILRIRSVGITIRIAQFRGFILQPPFRTHLVAILVYDA